MIYSLIIQVEAARQIRDAFNWYQEQNEGLGHEFLNEIEFCYKKISAHPERYSYINSIYRRIKLNRFPYFIIYEYEDDGDTVIVVKVRHVKQKPI